MTFNTRGYLNAGFHVMTLRNIEETFVNPFPHSSTRRNVMNGYKKHTKEPEAIITDYVQFVDGSFVSNKNDPGDVDLVCFIDGDKVDALPPSEQAKLRALFLGAASKASYQCDAYFSPSYPAGHPNYSNHRMQRKYWMGEFGFDRVDVPKGIVLVDERLSRTTPLTAPASSRVGP